GHPRLGGRGTACPLCGRRPPVRVAWPTRVVSATRPTASPHRIEGLCLVRALRRARAPPDRVAVHEPVVVDRELGLERPARVAIRPLEIDPRVCLARLLDGESGESDPRRLDLLRGPDG